MYVVLNASFRFLTYSSIDFWDISNHGFVFLMLLSPLNSSSAVIFMYFDNQSYGSLILLLLLLQNVRKMYITNCLIQYTIHHNSLFLLQSFWTSNCWASVNKLKSTQEVCSMYFFPVTSTENTANNTLPGTVMVVIDRSTCSAYFLLYTGYRATIQFNSGLKPQDPDSNRGVMYVIRGAKISMVTM